MELQGKQLIAGVFSASGDKTFQAVNPTLNMAFGTHYVEALTAEVAQACEAAHAAFRSSGVGSRS